MTQAELGWGAGPTARYDVLAGRFRPIFQRIAESAVDREAEHRLPREEIGWLREAGFTRLRIPESGGGLGATAPELFALVIELSAADPNVTNALRAHTGFIEDLLNAPDDGFRARWFARAVAGELVGSGFSEAGDSKVSAFSTTIVRNGKGWVLNGRKYYTTGSLFADWINLAGVDAEGQPIAALVPTHAPGVEIVDDWDGFGQQLSASGTATFADVHLDEELVKPTPVRFRYATAFHQHVHVATLAGIARAAASDVARLVAERKRIYSHGNAGRAGEDPQILQVVGAVRAAAYGAGAIALKAAEALQHAYDARDLDEERKDAVSALADLEVNQAVRVVTDLVLGATTQLFDALGASAAKRGYGLDRHWRNARTIASHNPRIYRDRIVGDFAVNGTRPAIFHRVGAA
ncbi:acyl-CoA dehydrogenase family protein [Bosea sp. RCC_152_1]|uniref:acyl-CoA dehydrogenase family protein n=1 Tax=Bosea sp. RCC_152_1 TaxID=3239228 RepID=UPI0035266F94